MERVWWARPRGVCAGLERAGVVFFSERHQLSGGDRRAAGDAAYQERIEEGSGFALPEFDAGIPLRHERFADPLDAAAFEHAESPWSAVLGVSAAFCQRCFASGRQRIWLVNERGGRGGGGRRTAFRGE